MDKFSSSRYFPEQSQASFIPWLIFYTMEWNHFQYLLCFFHRNFFSLQLFFFFFQHGKFHYFKNIFTEVQLIPSVVRFKYTARWFSYAYLSIYLSKLLSHYRVLQSVEYSSLYYTADPYWILFLCVLVFTQIEQLPVFSSFINWQTLYIFRLCNMIFLSIHSTVKWLP